MSNPQSSTPAELDPGYIKNKKSWITNISNHILNNDNLMKYANTKHKFIMPGPLKTNFYQPYGTFMDFSSNVYLEPKIYNLKFNPATDVNINNLDDFLLKTEIKNQALIKSVLNDFTKM